MALTIKVNGAARETVAMAGIPILGRIAAGAPIEALQSEIGRVTPPPDLADADHFALEVKGDSMIGASIESGDKVIVDRALTPKHDDIVVAVVAGDYTLKRLYKHAGRVELRAQNPAYPPIVFHDGSELIVWGVVVGVVRRYAGRC